VVKGLCKKSCCCSTHRLFWIVLWWTALSMVTVEKNGPITKAHKYMCVCWQYRFYLVIRCMRCSGFIITSLHLCDVWVTCERIRGSTRMRCINLLLLTYLLWE